MILPQKFDERIHIFAGQYAIYKTQSFYDYFDFIANTYHNLTPSAINPVFHDGDLTFCMRKFGDGVVFPNLTWTIDFNHLVPVEKCIVVDLKNAERPFSSRDYLKKMNFEVPWHTLQDMRLNFTLKTLTYIKVSERQPFQFSSNPHLRQLHSSWDRCLDLNVSSSLFRLTSTTATTMAKCP